MIRGMVHNVLGAQEYYPLKVSIQGKSDAVITNVQRVYKFDRDPKSRPDNPYQVTVKNSLKTATHGISFVDLHVNMRLIIHILFQNDNDNDNLIKKLENELQNNIPILGRNDDIALIEDLKIVTLKNFTGRQIQSKLPMFVLKDVLIENVGTRYRLPFWYEKVESFEDNRIFNFVEANYISEGVSLKKDNIFVDDEDIVCLLSSQCE
jgi:CRISPR-associated protein Cas5t